MVRSLVIALALTAPLGGCVTTSELWAPPERPAPQYMRIGDDIWAQELLRDGVTDDGVVHVEARFSDGSNRHLTLDPVAERLSYADDPFPDGARPIGEDGPALLHLAGKLAVSRGGGPAQILDYPERPGDRSLTCPVRVISEPESRAVTLAKIFGKAMLTPVTLTIDVVAGPTSVALVALGVLR